jgi:hypothetical protein
VIEQLILYEMRRLQARTRLVDPDLGPKIFISPDPGPGSKKDRPDGLSMSCINITEGPKITFALKIAKNGFRDLGDVSFCRELVALSLYFVQKKLFSQLSVLKNQGSFVLGIQLPSVLEKTF